jgi:hypothetical protein
MINDYPEPLEFSKQDDEINLSYKDLLSEFELHYYNIDIEEEEIETEEDVDRTINYIIDEITDNLGDYYYEDLREIGYLEFFDKLMAQVNKNNQSKLNNS